MEALPTSYPPLRKRCWNLPVDGMLLQSHLSPSFTGHVMFWMFLSRWWWWWSRAPLPNFLHCFTKKKYSSKAWIQHNKILYYLNTQAHTMSSQKQHNKVCLQSLFTCQQWPRMSQLKEDWIPYIWGKEGRHVPTQRLSDDPRHCLKPISRGMERTTRKVGGQKDGLEVCTQTGKKPTCHYVLYAKLEWQLTKPQKQRCKVIMMRFMKNEARAFVLNLVQLSGQQINHAELSCRRQGTK